jgi:hypothetical protein
MKVGWVLILGWAVLVLAPVVTESAAAERGVVKGASAVNVRRGPGTGHRAFAALAEGDEVEVVRVDGVWAVVRMRDGTEGYVRKDYLALRPGVEPSAAGRVPAAISDPGDPSSTSLQPEAPREVGERLTAEETSPRELVNTGVVSSQAAEVPGSTEPVAPQDDLQRLIRMTEELHRMVAELGNHRHGGREAAPEPWLVSNGWVLVLGALFGGFIGAAYGRAQERRRRTRVRF